jgi:hypothetical protein
LSNSDVISCGKPLPRIVACRPLPQFGLEVLWAKGGIDIIDVHPALKARALFEGVRSSEQAFAACTVDEDGTCIAWPEGAELSAVWIARLAVDRVIPKASSEYRI